MFLVGELKSKNIYTFIIDREMIFFHTVVMKNKFHSTTCFFFFFLDEERLVFAKKSKNQNLNCLLLFQNIKIDGDYVHKELKTFVVLVILSCLSFAVQMPILFSEFVASSFLHSQQLIFQVHEPNKLWVLVNWYCISHLNRYLLSLIFS